MTFYAIRPGDQTVALLVATGGPQEHPRLQLTVTDRHHGDAAVKIAREAVPELVWQILFYAGGDPYQLLNLVVDQAVRHIPESADRVSGDLSFGALVEG